MRIIRKIIKVTDLLRSFLWCLLHNVQYKKGVYIGHHVKMRPHVKLELSEYSRIGNNVLLWGNGPISIGTRTSIGPESRIYASDGYGVQIGDYVNSASHLYIIDSNHGIEKDTLMLDQPMTHNKVIIGSDIWFGYHVTVVPGGELEDGIVCGACSVVTKRFPKNAVIGGVPARVIKYRE